MELLGSNARPWEVLTFEEKEKWEEHVFTIETQDREDT